MVHLSMTCQLIDIYGKTSMTCQLKILMVQHLCMTCQLIDTYGTTPVKDMFTYFLGHILETILYAVIPRSQGKYNTWIYIYISTGAVTYFSQAAHLAEVEEQFSNIF